MTEREKLETAIAAQESMRATLGDAVVDISVKALREKLASLDAPSTAEQRKLVTILFADVSGFTAMSETMDAEEVRDTMNALWEKLDAAILKHGGRVDKHIGDALMAIFGVPAAKEDDPDRAVRAALALQGELKAFAEKTGRELRMRIGVNTGAALLGAVGSNSEFTAMGDAVNLASRLEHAAPIGGILISHDTYIHVRGIFDFEAQKPLEVKGKRELIQTYVVVRAKPRSFRIGTRGLDIETKMVGRDAELKQLQDGMESAFDDRESQMTTVVADAGMGKSRLLYEFTQWFELHPKRFWYFAGRASPETAVVPYGLLRDVLAQRFEVGDGDSLAEVHRKFEAGVAGFLKDDPRAVEKAHYIGRLVGYDFSASPHVQSLASNPTLVRERGVESVLEIMRAAEQKQPLLLLLEDVHWADDASLDLIAGLVTREKNLRLFVLALARPTLYERRPSWGEGLAVHRRIDLAQLSKRDSRRLVDDILSKVEALPDSLRETLVTSSEGNPFYVEELIRMMMEDGVIDRSGERWRVDTARLAEAKVPPTLVGVLQARLDSLQPAEREVLQCASVIGRIFWDAGVSELTAAADGDVFEKLRKKEMVFRREGSAFTGAEEFIFKHALLRDVAYESVLKKQRRNYHTAAGEWLSSRCGERAGEFASQIARHYELAGENVKAASYLRRAANDALRRGNPGEGADIVRNALRLDTQPGASRAELLRDAARILPAATAYDEAQKAADECVQIYRSLGDKKGLAAAMNERCGVLRQRGDFAALADGAETFQALAAELGDKKITADALNQAAHAASAGRDYPKAAELQKRSLALRTELGAYAEIASNYNQLGILSVRMGENVAARKNFEAAIENFRTVGDRLNEYLAIANLGQILGYLGERSLARETLNRAAKFHRENGIYRFLANTLDSLAELSEAEGDFEGARKLFLEAIEMGCKSTAAPPLLTMLSGYARLMGRNGHAAEVVEPLACVLTHPSTNGEALGRAKEARSAIEAVVGAKAVDDAVKKGPPPDLFAFAAALLRED